MRLTGKVTCILKVNRIGVTGTAIVGAEVGLHWLQCGLISCHRH